MERLEFFTPAAERTFRAAAEVILPPLDGGESGDRDEVVRVADAALARRPAGDQSKLRLFLGAVEKLPILRYGRSFSKLSFEKRAKVLAYFEHNETVPKLRQGFYGLKTFVLMGHYGSASSFGEIEYPGPRMDAPYYQRRGSDA